MAKPHVTVTGNVGNDPIQRTTNSGTPVALFSVAQNHWRPGPRNTWEDAGTSWYSVVCRWGWSENVAKSLKKGDPVVVIGRLRINERVSEQGEVRVTAEIDAISVGHDLRRGTTEFTKVERARSQMPNDEDEISEMIGESRPTAAPDPFPSPSTPSDGSEPPSDPEPVDGSEPQTDSDAVDRGDGALSEDNPPDFDADTALPADDDSEALQPAV